MKTPEEIAKEIVVKWDEANFDHNYIPATKLVTLIQLIEAAIEQECKARVSVAPSDSEIYRLAEDYEIKEFGTYAAFDRNAALSEDYADLPDDERTFGNYEAVDYPCHKCGNAGLYRQAFERGFRMALEKRG